MAKKKKRVGRRPLPPDQKKVTLKAYPRKWEVDAVGGASAAARLAEDAISKAAGIMPPI